MHTLQCTPVLMLTCIHCHTNITRHTFAHAVMCTHKHTAIHTCAYPSGKHFLSKQRVKCVQKECHVHTAMYTHVHMPSQTCTSMHIACAQTPTYGHARTCTQWHTQHMQLIKGPQNPFFPLSSRLNPDSYIYSSATVTVTST